MDVGIDRKLETLTDTRTRAEERFRLPTSVFRTKLRLRFPSFKLLLFSSLCRDGESFHMVDNSSISMFMLFNIHKFVDCFHNLYAVGYKRSVVNA
ncbi:hypothetical protein L1987_16740 [Smallanthus sonchifolius]|uniref:Uncharacterized protein n=1 Tax=Smallanthus sonchifolius TaxID=185202 RepID=A0ACB9IVI4_9ASTR|nr:hypothetical protein L1987_16740 [Smallanthus sonchifolius]